MSNRVGDAFKDEDCFNSEQLAEALGVSVQRARSLMNQALEKRLVQNIAKKVGTSWLYPEPMVRQLQEARQAGKFGKPRNRKTGSALHRAHLVIQVPIYDAALAKNITGTFGSEADVAQYLHTQLQRDVQPLADKKRELEEEFDRQVAALMRKFKKGGNGKGGQGQGPGNDGNGPF